MAAVGSVSSMVAAKLMIEQGMNPWVSILISCIVGLLLGMINGLFIAHLRLTPFIVTLATGEIYKGIVYIVTKGTPSGTYRRRYERDGNFDRVVF